MLAAAPGKHAGAASGVNNAVARSAGLLAVALVPPIAGLTGEDYRSPAAFAAASRVATLVNAGLLLAGAMLAAIGMRNEVPQVAAEPEAARAEGAVKHAYCCPLDGPRAGDHPTGSAVGAGLPSRRTSLASL